MGTNYYLHTDVCPHCGRGESEDGKHIGKSSAGWCFSLHVYPDEGINTLEDWREKWGEGIIRNEYGEEISAISMNSIIEDRSRPKMWDTLGGDFYDSEDDFHEKNGSERGPSGMLRHKVDHVHCIGHGEGTWDYVIGDFS